MFVPVNGIKFTVTLTFGQNITWMAVTMWIAVTWVAGHNVGSSKKNEIFLALHLLAKTCYPFKR